MKTKSVLLSIAAAILLMSCGGKKAAKKPESITLKPKTTVVKGELGDCFEVVDASYSSKNEMYTDILIVELKRTEKPLPLDPEKTTVFGTFGIDVDYNAGFALEIFSDQGPEIVNSAADVNSMIERDQLKTILKLKSGETAYLKLKLGDIRGKQLSTFQVVSAIEKKSHSSAGVSDENTDAATTNDATADDDAVENDNTASTSVDCDAFYREYEEFVNSYIKILKKYKANPSDMSIVTDYNEAASKAIQLEREIPSCASTQYASRLLALQQKLARAAL